MIHVGKYSLIALILTVWAMNAVAQSDPCINYLKDAQQRADEGKYDEGISLIKKAIAECDFSKNDLIEANKLLILYYLQTDFLEEAEASAARIMRLSPNYEPNNLRDPIELVRIFRKYKPTPVFNLALVGGVNSSRVEVLNSYSVLTGSEYEDRTIYSGQYGWQLGLSVEKRVWSNLWLLANAQYRTSNYEAYIDSLQGQRIDYREELGFFDLGLSARYYVGNWQLQPFVEIGGQYTLLTSALGELTREGQSDLVNRLPQRNTSFPSYYYGGGLAYSKKGISIRLGVQLHDYDRNIVNPDRRFDNLDVIFRYFYLDNDFVMNHLQFNLGIAYTLRYRNLIQSQYK